MPLTYICALPHPKRAGRIPELFSANPDAIEAFARRWDRPGYGVFSCVNPLREGSTRRLPENAAGLVHLQCDLDLRRIQEPRDCAASCSCRAGRRYGIAAAAGITSSRN
jgi:hypothetical protein